MDHMDLFTAEAVDPSRRAVALKKFIRAYQDSFTAIEKVGDAPCVQTTAAAITRFVACARRVVLAV
jgi:hypothetical protein